MFTDRYHAVVLRNPTQTRNALAYVLNNWRKHREDRYDRANVDKFSTGVLFSGWRERENARWFWKWNDDDYKPLVVYLQTWMLSEGWKRGGGTIPFNYVPSTPRGRGFIEPT